MGLVDTLHDLITNTNQPKTIYQDGKVYTFTPGKNGSLTAPAPLYNKEQQSPVKTPEQNPSRNRIIMPPQTGSSRG